jgi:hypothetical protein
LELVKNTVDPWLIVIEAALGVEVCSTVTVVVPLIVDVAAALVVTLPSVTVPLMMLVLLAGSGVIVRLSSSVITNVEVDVRSGDVIEVVAVTFCVLVWRTSAPVIEIVCVIFKTVVEVASGAVISVLAVSFAVNVVVVKAVKTGSVLEGIMLREDNEALDHTVDDGAIDDDAVLQVCAEPTPTVKGCVSTYWKSMNAVEVKKEPNWN